MHNNNNSTLNATGDVTMDATGDTPKKKKRLSKKDTSGACDTLKPQKKRKKKTLKECSDFALSQDDDACSLPGGALKSTDADASATATATTTEKKKRRYTKKKSIAAHLGGGGTGDENTDSNQPSMQQLLLPEESASSLSCMTPDIEFPASTRPKGRGRGVLLAAANNGDPASSLSMQGGTPGRGLSGPGRRKSAAHLVNFVKKNSRKKRKKTSSGEDEDADDDSDDVEFQVAPAAKSKREETTAAATEPGANNGGEALEHDTDEATAQLLQATENKRRSTRAVAAKRQKCGVAGDSYVLKDEDLMLPPTAEDLAGADEQTPAANANSNIVLDSNFIVDKILGFRLFKRKTKRKVEKPPKEPKSKVKTKKKTEKKSDQPEAEPRADNDDKENLVKVETTPETSDPQVEKKTVRFYLKSSFI